MKRWRTYLLGMLLPALALLLLQTDTMDTLAAENAAATMQLTKAEGNVEVSSSTGKSISMLDDMRLYNGYEIETMEESYAWISLDKSKLAKLDAVSKASVRKSGKQLEILAESGTLLFNVVEPLEEDETLNIRVSTMVAGIRGTCGWIEVIDESRTQLTLLEGAVEVSVIDPVNGQSKMESVSAGETVICQVYEQTKEGDKCDIRREKCVEEDVPGFVLEELFQDPDLRENIYRESGIDLRELTEQDVEKRLQEDKEAVSGRLAEIAENLTKQEEQSTTNLVWGDTDNVPATEEQTASASSSVPAEVPAPSASQGTTENSVPKPPVEKTYTVTFETQGGSAVSSAAVKSGDRVVKPADPTRTGYSFNGWYTDAACTAAYDFSLPVTGELTLYANWTPVTYEVRFETNGLSLADGAEPSRTVQAGTAIGELPELGRPQESANYSFSGWYTERAEGQEVTSSTIITDNMTVYARWYNWVLDGSDNLTISGAGPMLGYTECGPWDGNRVRTAVIMDGITRIGSNAFRFCSNLASVTIPGSVTSIGIGAFSGCSGLTNVTIPDSVTSIGDNTFLNCSSLTSVTIPGSITSIGANAFYNCSKLTNVYFGGSESRWGELGYIFPDSVTMHYNGSRNLLGAAISEGSSVLDLQQESVMEEPVIEAPVTEEEIKPEEMEDMDTE